MMALHLTALYASGLAIIFVILTARVITYRRANKIGLGDGEDKSLLKRMRAQGNFVDSVPFALILLALAESQGTAPWALHLLGLTLLWGRALHAYGFSASPPKMKLRVFGMVLTLVMIIVTALLVLAKAIAGLT